MPLNVASHHFVDPLIFGSFFVAPLLFSVIASLGTIAGAFDLPWLAAAVLHSDAKLLPLAF